MLRYLGLRSEEVVNSLAFEGKVVRFVDRRRGGIHDFYCGRCTSAAGI